MSGWQKKTGAITLFVEDPDRSKAFYQEVFDLQPMLEDDTGAGFRLQDMFLFLTRSSHAPALIAPAAAGSPGNGPRHVFAIIVDDVDAVCAESGPDPGKGRSFPTGAGHAITGGTGRHQRPFRAVELTWRIRLTWRKWTPMGYRILRVSHFLRAISRRGESACTWVSRAPQQRHGSLRPLARIEIPRK
jgi:catechol 2,3-dioxygenase-like lactoylglutathione lyase family enzyme